MELEIIDIRQIEQRTMYLPNWNVELTVLFTPEGPYFIVNQLCAVLGVTDSKGQATKLRDHEVLSRLLRKLPVTTPTRGRQIALCIYRRGLAWWWAGINLAKVRPEVRIKLLELQEEVVDAAERVMFVEVAVSTVREVTNLADLTLALERRIGRIEAHIDMPLEPTTDEE